MKKRAKICLYIFVFCAFFALGILSYFVFNSRTDNVMVGSKKFVTFNEIPNARTYSLSVTNSKNEISGSASYKITKSKTQNIDEYKFVVDVNKGDSYIAQESYLQQIKSRNDDAISCDIKDYKISFFGDNGDIIKTAQFEDQYLDDVDKNIFCCVVSEYFGSFFCEDGKYYISLEAFDEYGEIIEESKTNVEYDYYAYYKDDFVRRGEYFINGKYFDYIIDSKEELKYFVWHTILYREDNISAFIDTNDINTNNINYLVNNAIDDYPEYAGIEDKDSYVSMQKNIICLVNLEYFLDSDCTKTYQDLEQVDENLYKSAVKALHKQDKNYNVGYIKSDDATNRTFDIDSREEVKVYNTEQLFMVVQYGAKPSFEDGECVAKTVYENALSQLKIINNSDSLTDYQKALNIYRYLCQNVVYDYVTYEFMKLKNDMSIYSFGSYGCFHLEGVFLDLDNQYAVCDGLSKAYVLLCNIEGIPCIKVNGEVDDYGHAWNKVRLDDESGEEKWYYVDTTWGMAQYIDGFGNNIKYYQVLTHAYFLSNEDEGKVAVYEANNTVIASDFDYYQNTKFEYIDDDETSHEGDFYIESDEELRDILLYGSNRVKKGNLDSFVLEIKIDSNYELDNSSNINYFLSHKTPRFQINNYLDSIGFDNSIDLDWITIEDLILFRVYK